MEFKKNLLFVYLFNGANLTFRKYSFMTTLEGQGEDNEKVQKGCKRLLI